MTKFSETFSREINLIKSNDLKNFTIKYLDEYVPSYFGEIGASSSGKFHPKFAQGEGGLIRHTKAVVMFAEELLKMSSYAYLTDEYKDFIIVACICHDTCKYGMKKFDKGAYAEHGENASALMAECWADMYGYEYAFPQLLGLAVTSHMGQWGAVRPMTSIDRCVHMADYMASRNFIDIPTLATED